MKVGIQLYSVRDQMAIDPVATIKKVVASGYKYLEIANHNAVADSGVGFGVSAEEIKKILDDAGASIVSGHVRPLNGETLPKVIAYNQAIGNKNLVDPSEDFADYDDVMRKCEMFNSVGKTLKENGLRFLYHNHTQEFQTVNGKYILDILMENTDPAYLGLQVDTFWALRSGVDPIEVIKKHKERVTLVHQKDISKGVDPVDMFKILSRELSADHGTLRRDLAKDTDFAEIGTGTMEIQGIIDASNEIGVEYIILEQDRTQLDQMESIKVSMDAFRKFNGISWN